MDIAAAKQQIKNTVKIYLQKDALGRYKVPLVHQRPVFLLGAPGLGKTAILQQIADEMGLGLVSYSMTHHTRQSALGLPMIVKKSYGGKEYSMSEYTMSEIIASVYDCIERTGRSEGILFLDEINCVSETLSPAMLLFLQYKVFGGHRIPEGWVVVTAGNPPRYNKSVREFDSATRDRLKIVEVEPNYEAWKKYALAKNLSRAVISFLDIRQDCFYIVQNTVDGMAVVTPRAWEDLSECIALYEENALAVDENLIAQYIQNRETARDFAIYYDLYQKYRSAYDVPAILAGSAGAQAAEKAAAARVDERMSLVSLLLEAVFNSMTACTLRHDALRLLRGELLAQKQQWSAPAVPAAAAVAQLQAAVTEKADAAPESELPTLTCSAEILSCWRGKAGAQTPAFGTVKALYAAETEALKASVAEAQAQIGNMLSFLKSAFGKGTELSLAVNDLSVSPQATAFIGQFLSTEFFAAGSELMLHKQEEALLHTIELEGLA